MNIIFSEAFFKLCTFAFVVKLSRSDCILITTWLCNEGSIVVPRKSICSAVFILLNDQILEHPSTSAQAHKKLTMQSWSISSTRRLFSAPFSSWPSSTWPRSFRAACLERKENFSTGNQGTNQDHQYSHRLIEVVFQSSLLLIIFR